MAETLEAYFSTKSSSSGFKLHMSATTHGQALGLKQAGGFQRDTYHGAYGDDCRVGSCAQLVGFAYLKFAVVEITGLGIPPLRRM